ncbi:LytTR family DNA-binding domain-containing protein [Aliiglaciecola sp. CAU 1673]|uniref:LytR/AlgR family response regulator transcription factor n=1 Tax=Aliiglaciecola sp. CAU 1673 TaxID=3032595 RepID=UPI0023DADEB6|nr:LytTR family DNA-binding domain-containing protein [Aliiglaciecola sp. CAU 1673]MDF2176808.1 LytTR family DNA-binding domain-containing protein [Aliiglaciecola sp. CAU 1673]
MINVLVADDETLARQTICLLLKDQEGIGEVFEAADGNQAVALYQKEQPQLVFLDIQMPGLTGLQVAEQIGRNSVILFVTAYDQYAIQAFELSAVDYLLKPYDDERFHTALERAKNRLKEKQFGDHQQIGELLRHMMSEQDRHYKSRLVVKDPGRIRLIDVADVDFILGAGNYAELHLFDGKVVLHRETLGSLESQLDPSVFVRIHRSSIVRQSRIAELKPNEKGDYSVLLKSGHELTLSRRNKHKLSDLLG